MQGAAGEVAGRVAEWSIAPVLKTGKVKAFVGSNPTPSARIGAFVAELAAPDGAMLALLECMKSDDLTVHGFRSTFRDWAAECTSYPQEVCEMALAHAISDKTEEAYRRGDLFDKRRRLRADWERFCSRPMETATVLKIGKLT